MTDTNFSWDRAKVKRVLDVLKTLPDFHRLPLPLEIHKAFDIPLNKPKSENVMSYVEKVMQIREHSHVDGFEIRETPKDTKFPEFNHGSTVYPELALDTPATTVEQLDDSTESNDSMPRLTLTVPTIPEESDALNRTPSAPKPTQDSP